MVFGGIGKAVVQGCSFFNTFGTSRAVINSAIDLDVADSSFTLGIVTEGCGAIYATTINIRNSYFYSNISLDFGNFYCLRVYFNFFLPFSFFLNILSSIVQFLSFLRIINISSLLDDFLSSMYLILVSFGKT